MLQKLSRTARILDTLVKIASVCCVVGFCVVAVAAVLLFGFANASMVDFTGLEVGFLTFELAQTTPAMLRSAFLSVMLPAVVLLVFGYAVLQIIRRVLAPMKNGQPFDTSVSGNLRKLCWLTITGGLLSQLLGTFASAYLSSAYDFANLFLNENITGVRLNLQMDMTFVVLGAVWYLLSCVFRYGEELQKQSDETL